jgi:tetratricopeptide (TPR) repeat protein
MRLAFAMTLLLALALATTAHAQVNDTDAIALFKHGQELYRDGKFDESYEAYKKAWDLQKGYDIAGNLGNVEVKLGKYKGAVIHLQYVLDNLPPSIDAERREKIVSKTQQRLNDARSHVAIVKLAMSPDGASVSVDGNDLGTTPLAEPIVLDAGTHQLVAKLDGYDDVSHEINATSGSQETLRIAMVAKGSGGTAAIETGGGSDGGDTADDGPSLAIIIAGSVIGVGALGGGIGLLVAASGKASDREDLLAALGSQSGCGGASPPAQCAEIGDLSDQEGTFNTVGAIMLVGGGVVLAATAVYALWPRGGDDETGVRVLPTLGPGHAGLTLNGSF